MTATEPHTHTHTHIYIYIYIYLLTERKETRRKWVGRKYETCIMLLMLDSLFPANLLGARITMPTLPPSMCIPPNNSYLFLLLLFLFLLLSLFSFFSPFSSSSYWLSPSFLLFAQPISFKLQVPPADPIIMRCN